MSFIDHFRCSSAACAVLSFVISFSASSLLAQTNPTPTPTPTPTPQSQVPLEEWDTQIPRIALLQGRAADLIFDSIEDLHFLSVGFGDVHIGASSARHVYDNHDLKDSWTVFDRMQLTGSIPLVTAAFSPGSLWLGTNQTIEIDDIRQVLPEDYEKLPPLDTNGKGLSQVASLKSDFANDDPHANGNWGVQIDEKGDKKVSYFAGDPENHARFSDLWRLVDIPFRLPLKWDGFQKMQNQEVISYLAQGGIELGGSVGWNFTPVNVQGNLGMSLTTFLSGSFRISIMKEDARYARVKVSKMGSKGFEADVGQTDKGTFLSGILIVSALGSQMKFIPFQFGWQKQWGNEFDVGYRYDLNDPAGKAAYERAVVGRFALSEELANKAKASGAHTVERIFTRDMNRDITSRTQKLQIAFLFRQRESTSLTNMDAKVTLPDGTHKIFSSIVENSKEWNTLWGSYQKLFHRFTISVDLDQYAKDTESKDAFQLTAEGSVDDSDANPRNLLAYILEAEDSVGKFGIFTRPPPPQNAKNKNFLGIPEDTDLGRARIYYQINFSQPQIEKFINTPRDQMWPMLEKAFRMKQGIWSTPELRGVGNVVSGAIFFLTSPLYLVGSPVREGNVLFHAENIYNHWIDAQERSHIKEQVEALGQLFYDPFYSYELIHLLRLTLDGEKIDYLVNGYSSAFGRVFDEGTSNIHFENIATRYQDLIDFDRDAGRNPVYYDGATVTNPRVSVLDPNQARLDFSLQSAPKALYIELLNVVPAAFGGKNEKSLERSVVFNAGEFLTGPNSITFNSKDSQSRWYKIAKLLKPGQTYRFRIALNPKGTEWGPTNLVEFKMVTGSQNVHR